MTAVVVRWPAAVLSGAVEGGTLKSDGLDAPVDKRIVPLPEPTGVEIPPVPALELPSYVVFAIG